MSPPEPIEVVIVDDNYDSRVLTALTLERSGIKIGASVESGSEMVEALEECEADVVLLDWRLPDIEGPQAITIVRERCPGAKVVIHTASGVSPELHAKMLAAGADLVLEKNLSGLVDDVKALVGGSPPSG